MPIDDRTTNRSYKLPNAGNFLADDVQRLRDALTAIDADVFARYTKTETDQKLADLINGAPGALNTLQELAAAMGNDPNFAATITNLLAGKPGFADVWTRTQADARYLQGVTQTENVFTGNGSQTTFTLTQTPPTRESLLVTVDGVVQPTTAYNLSGSALILSEAPASGASIRVLMLGVAGPVQSASTLNFTQAGTGAVTRTVDSKLKDVVSVKDFGAVGDGVANDTAAIQAAIAYCDSAKDKTLFFPAGTYKCNGVIGTFGCPAVGEGMLSSTIEYTGTAADFIVFTGSKYEGLKFLASNLSHASYFTKTPAAFISFNNCMWEGPQGAASGALLYMNTAINVEINGCFFNGHNLNLIGQDGGGSGFCNGVTISNTLFGAFKTGAIGNGGQGWTLQNCIFQHTPNPEAAVRAIYTDAPCNWYGTHISGCWFGDNIATAQSFIRWRGFGLSIDGCYVVGEGTNSCTFVELINTSSGISITGNYVANFAKLLETGEYATNVVVAGNRLSAVSTEISGTVSTGLLSQAGVNTNAVRFPATQVSSSDPNYLDDYEEGTWTPSLEIGGSITYTSRVGRYTKIGRQVTLYYSIVVATASGGAGAVTMSLPFACSGTDVDRQGYPGLIGAQTTSNTGLRYTGFYDDSSTAFFYGSGGNLVGTQVGANNVLSGTMTYFTAT